MTGYTNTHTLGSTNSWAPAVQGQRWWQMQPSVHGWHGRSLTGGFVQPNTPFVPVVAPPAAVPGTTGNFQRYGNNLINPQGYFTAGGHRRVYRSRGLNT